MTKRSNEDAIVEMKCPLASKIKNLVIEILFNISGVFNRVWWPQDFVGLKKRECPRNIYIIVQYFFMNRLVVLSWRFKNENKAQTRECPQKSVVGPLL